MTSAVQPWVAASSGERGAVLAPPPEIPLYLRRVYWWAYINPRCIRAWDRQWLTNLILWGNFARLRDAALDQLGTPVEGRTLQVACVYGDFTPRVLDRLAPGARLDVADIVPQQLSNLAEKLPPGAPVALHRCDSSDLAFADASFDQVVLFFLLHEQPEDVRRGSIAEAVRVLKPGGKLVVMDYHQPRWWHPLRYLFQPVLRVLEPFAMDLWRTELPAWLPRSMTVASVRLYFGGLYQMVVATR
jgi:ubiquinone/menaquinone biosynthesis C-methylase UbiE